MPQKKSQIVLPETEPKRNKRKTKVKVEIKTEIKPPKPPKKEKTKAPERKRKNEINIDEISDEKKKAINLYNALVHDSESFFTLQIK